MTATVFTKKGEAKEVTLTMKDIIDMQTPACKQTIALGVVTGLISLASLAMPAGSLIRKITVGLGTTMCIGSTASYINATRKEKAAEEIKRVEQIVLNAARRQGIDI